MRVPISPTGAAVSVVFMLACSVARVSAGVVAPPTGDPQLPIETSRSATPTGDIRGVATAFQAPLDDAQLFWFPGADDAAIRNISLSSVPVRGIDSEASTMLLGTQQHPLIPLPASAWTGMAGLLGLGALKLLRNARRLLA